MRTLFLVRHSKAVTRKANLPDFRRTLVKAGEKKSMSMAKKLKKEGVLPDLIISSTANRALETAHLFARNLDYPTHEIMVKDALYNEMSSEALLYLVRQVEDKYKSIMLFGHNPAFTDFASFLVRGFDQNIPKTGIVGIQFPKDSWKEVSKGSGKLEFFEYPRRLEKTMKRLEEELRSELSQKTLDILENIDAKSAKKLKKQVSKGSDKIAKDFIASMKATLIKEEKKAATQEKAKADRPKPEEKPTPKKSAAKKVAKAIGEPSKKTAPKKPVRTQAARPKTAPVPGKVAQKKPVKTQAVKPKRAPAPKKAVLRKPAPKKADPKKPVTAKAK
jgi:phosphohistidine phosphatase